MSDLDLFELQFQKERRSIIPAGDTSQFIPSKEADIAILEEPEHLNWYHHGKRWTDKFNHVVGVVHTNYLEYIKREKNGAIQAFFVKHINNMVARAYCNKVVYYLTLMFTNVLAGLSYMYYLITRLFVVYMKTRGYECWSLDALHDRSCLWPYDIIVL